MKERGKREAKPTSAELATPDEDLVKGKLFEVENHNSTLRVPAVAKLATFGTVTGLHSSYDTVVRDEVRCIIEHHEIRVETVSDGITYLRADTTEQGPEGWQIGWSALATIIALCVTYCLPIERVAKMLGTKFSDTQISRWLRHVATWLVAIYLELAGELAETQVFNLDDSPTLVLEMRKLAQTGLAGTEAEEDLDPLVSKVADLLGRTYPKADGDGRKKQVQVTLISGKSRADDPYSTINLYRTHFGDAGNLLSSLLSMRRRANRSFVLQGDLSTKNLPTPLYMRLFEVNLAGCGGHGRRPFWRHKDDDDELCDFMLRGFALLAYVEQRIDEIGRTRETTLRLRRKYSRRIWASLLRRAKSVAQAEVPADCKGHRFWPPAAELRIACRYLVKHEAKLTRYLDDPRLPWTNNRMERLLRAEVMLRVACKFRLTEGGRVVFDILRTIVMTCRSAGVAMPDYLRYVYKHRAEIEDRPESFTPYAFRLYREREAEAKAA